MVGTPKILVADDNVQVLGLVSTILQSAGYEVVACEGGVGAIEAARSSEFDLILLDGMMPDLDGFAACEQIRALRHHRFTPVVFLTGMTDDGTFEDATEVGADEVLPKPIRRSTLLLRVRSLLRLSQLRADRERLRASRSELTELLLGDLERPMTLVRARASALARSPDLAPSLRPAVDDLLAAERSLEDIIRNLMDVQRSEEGTFRARGGEVSLAQLFTETTNYWERDALAAGVRLVASGSVPTAPLWLDEALLRRALDSLVRHALLSARSEIVLSAAVTEEGVFLRVHDDGEPLTEDEQERLQLLDDGTDTVTGRLPRSRGLGLVLCRLVAEAHGGELALSSSDEGTRVRLRIQELPRDEEPA